jgi:hypothetical protein
MKEVTTKETTNMTKAQTLQQATDMGLFDVKGLEINPTVLTSAVTRYEAKVRVNDEPITWLADTIQLGIESSQYREVDTSKVGLLVNQTGDDAVITTVDIAKVPQLLKENTEDERFGWRTLDISTLFKMCAYVAIGARIVQTSGLKAQFDKKNFEYIALLFPVIANYGLYSNQAEAYDIVPVMGDELKETLQSLGCFSKDGKFIVPDWYPRAMLFFRSQKLMTGYGLPKDIHVDSPMFFKLTMENNMVIGHPGANVAEVLIATLVSSSKLLDLFGAYRTLYCGISTVRSAIENIGLKALHDLGA